MKRTQIYLDEKMYSRLERESRAEAASISEIIRQSVQERLDRQSRNLLKAAEEVFGLWKDRKFDVEAFVRKSRRDRKTW